MVALKEQVLSFGGAHEVLPAHMAPTSTVYSFPVNIFTGELCTCAPGPPCWLELRSRHARRNIRGDTHHRGLRRIFRLPQTSNHSVLARIWTHEEGRRNKTMPKAQRAWGLSSVYQSNFLRSYHKFSKKILIIFHLHNLDQAATSKHQSNISILTYLKLQNLDQT